MVDLDGELAELKRAVAHMDLGLKAVRVEMREGTDYKRLLASMRDQVKRIRDTADRAISKIDDALGKPTPAEEEEKTAGAANP